MYIPDMFREDRTETLHDAVRTQLNGGPTPLRPV